MNELTERAIFAIEALKMGATNLSFTPKGATFQFGGHLYEMEIFPEMAPQFQVSAGEEATVHFTLCNSFLEFVDRWLEVKGKHLESMAEDIKSLDKQYAAAMDDRLAKASLLIDYRAKFQEPAK